MSTLSGSTFHPPFNPLADELRILRRNLVRTLEARSEGPALARLTQIRARVDPNGKLTVQAKAGPDLPWAPLPDETWRDLARVGTAEIYRTFSPAETALLLSLALAARDRLLPATPSAPLPMTLVADLLGMAAAHPAIIQPDGSPLRIEGKLESRLTAIGDHFEARLYFPDPVNAEGREVAAFAYLGGRRPGYYLVESKVWQGPPLLHLRVPAPALQDEEVILSLGRLAISLPTPQPAVRRVATRAELRCWLEAAPDGSERLHLQVLATAEDPPCAQLWRPGGGFQWLPGRQPPPAPATVRLEFELSPAARLARRVQALAMEPGSASSSCSQRMTPEFADRFAAWLETREPATEVNLCPLLAAFLAPPTVARVRIAAERASSGIDWFDLQIDLRPEDYTLTLAETHLLAQHQGKWVRLPSGWRCLRTEVEPATAATLDQLGLSAAEVLATGKPASHRLHALQLAELPVDSILAELASARASTAAADAPLPAPTALVAQLRPYQLAGFNFLARLSRRGLGGILADDMGLGKTVQTIAWLLHLGASRPEAFRALVVAPKSVVPNWLAESARFAPSLPTRAFAPAQAATPAPAPLTGLWVANYAQLRIHREWFAAQRWDAVVLDEGQFIKNPESQVAGAARRLQAGHRLVLSGTPIENRLDDLWSLFAFAEPRLLGNRTAFRRQYAKGDPSTPSRLQRRVRPLLLRRTKAEAAPELPPRTEVDLVLELEPGQRELYEAELKFARSQLKSVASDEDLTDVRFSILASLTRLRQICCHPALIDPRHRPLGSAKLEALLERVQALREQGHQVLVFSQFVEMLELMRDELNLRGIEPLLLTGATENRAALVEEFQRQPERSVFLLSLKAAGFGLNLTAASYAILYDPWWNPAVEAQAIDRTHRIGQARPVTAYRLLAADSIELKLRKLQQEKSHLANGVIQPAGLNLADLRRILE